MKNPRFLILAFLAPSLLLYVLFVVVPSFNAFRYSLTNWDGLSAPKYVGLKNFAAIVDSRAIFAQALQHNVYLMLVPGAITLILALYFAYTLHRGVPFGKVFRVAFFFPYVISSVAVTLL